MLIIHISISIFLSALLAVIIERVSIRYQITPTSSYRRKSGENVALLGGVGIVIAIMPGLFYFNAKLATPLLFCFLPLFIGGILDDLNELRGRTKLTLQIGAAILWLTVVPMEQNLFFKLTGHTYSAYPLTIAWIVGMTNAFNMIDGIDGQATSFGIIGFAAMAILSNNDPAFWIISAVLIGFLARNFYPARIYLGDVGSHFIGFGLAATSLIIPIQTPDWSHFVGILFLFSVPLSDTVSAIYRRISNDVSLFAGDREHIHHRLIKLRFSAVQALMISCTLAASSTLTGILSFRVEGQAKFFLFAQSGSILTLTFAGIFLLEKRMSQRLLGLSSQMIAKHISKFEALPASIKNPRALTIDLLPYFRELQGEGALQIHNFLDQLTDWIQLLDGRAQLRSLGSYSLLAVMNSNKSWTEEEIKGCSEQLYKLLHTYRVVRNTKPIPEGVMFLDPFMTREALTRSEEIAALKPFKSAI